MTLYLFIGPKKVQQFDPRVTQASGIEVIHTPYAAPHANAICERIVGSWRWECLDHVLVIGVLRLIRTQKECVSYFNQARPHQGIAQRIPAPIVSPPGEPQAVKVIAFLAAGSQLDAGTSPCVHAPSMRRHILPFGFLSRSSAGRRGSRTLS